MLKQRKFLIPLVICGSTFALLLGVFLPQLSRKFTTSSLTQEPPTTSAAKLLKLVSLSPAERAAPLTEISQETASQSRSRARYLLAVDLLQQKNAKQALEVLKDLETEYPVLAGYVLQKQAQAYELLGNQDQAKKTWERLLKHDPQQPVTVEALYALGKTQPTYWQQAITEFPAHPRTVEIAHRQLQKNPNSLPLLLVIAKYGLYLPDYGTILEQLKSKYALQLKPEEWEVLAFGYWEKQDYGKGALAYARAPRTPQNLYRYGRGLWLDGKVAAARKAYQQLVAEFPNGGDDTGLGLLRLSRISDPKPALIYLDQVISRFPPFAPEALLDKAKLLDKQNAAALASQARQQLLSQYSQSESAAQLRWNLAQEAAKAGNYQAAWKWAQELTRNNPESEIAPEAAFWVGKWAQRLGREKDAKTAFEYTLANYPQSYFAWRSAVLLGWQVGDFTTVRFLVPQLVKIPERQQLPMGSETLKELYLLGQDQAAWELWQVEFKNRMKPSVAEQFTDGILRMGVGDYLDGMWMLASLSQRENPEERAQYLALKHQPDYWKALYPFPYSDLIVKWSKERELNPVLVTALIRQESRFMKSIKSGVGAAGLMQVMPDTGAWVAQKIQLKNYSLENPSDNIQLGTWYFSMTHDEYKNNSLLALASYNAGPGNVSDWVQRFGFNDPDEFVNKIPFPETNGYVKSVFENYWNYLRFYNPEINELLAQYAADHQKK